MKTISISSTVRSPLPNHPYEAIKDAILGRRYSLSLVFIGSARAKTLNQKTRGKSYTPNVLSFPLSDSTGEIYICPMTTKTEAEKFGLSEKNYLAYLFIHGCLHLKGLNHGAKMDRLETKYINQFKLN